MSLFKKLHTVIYNVNNIDTARESNIKATGIEPYFNESFYVGFDINGFELGLDPDSSHFTAGNQTVSYWSVDNVSDVSLRLVDWGAKLIQPKTNVGGSIEVVIIEDPFGNRIGLIQGA